MTAFELDPRLGALSHPVGSLKLSRLLLMGDRRWPWLILVPERPGIVEIFDLSPLERAELMEEAADLAQALKAITSADKINVGSLGNAVPQLHFHVVARRDGDTAWPGPVWGVQGAEPYCEGEADALIQRIRQAVHIS